MVIFEKKWIEDLTFFVGFHDQMMQFVTFYTSDFKNCQNLRHPIVHRTVTAADRDGTQLRMDPCSFEVAGNRCSNCTVIWLWSKCPTNIWMCVAAGWALPEEAVTQGPGGHGRPLSPSSAPAQREKYAAWGAWFGLLLLALQQKGEAEEETAGPQQLRKTDN